MLAYFQDLEETKLLGIVRELYFNNPSEKVLVVAPTFRQAIRLSKILGWRDNSLDIKRDLDMVRLNDNRIVFMGLGDGTKVRGLRYNNLFLYNDGAMPAETLQTVIMGFQITSEDPLSLVQERVLEKKRKDQNENSSDNRD